MTDTHQNETNVAQATSTDAQDSPQPIEQPGGPNYGRYVLFVLIIVYIFNFIDRQILSILAEEIKLDLGIGDAEIGFLYGTAFAVFYAVLLLPVVMQVVVLLALMDSWYDFRSRLASRT